jgi:hypothetical protein
MKVLAAILSTAAFWPALCATAQTIFIDPTLSIDTIVNPHRGQVYVNSFARAILYGSNNQRIYDKQVILGHQVWEIDRQLLMYQARVVSDIGYANSAAQFLPGAWNHCYGAEMAVHVNHYNYHNVWTSMPDCVEPPPEIDPIDPPDENCPVILDLAQDGFHLSGPDPAVSFDIDADGVRNQIAWTRANDDDAFLCLDRNHNGVIDDGRELFGYATLLWNGQPARIGYVALAELDSPEAGGNRDGKIDGSDQSFHSLCAWIDANRDGVSQAHEIHGLEESRVVALSYSYRMTRLRDTYGNLFRYVSRADMRTPSGAVLPWPTFDVIFTQ